MLGELTGQEQTNGCLHLSGRKSLLLVVSDKSNRFLSDFVEDIVDEGIHDAHRLLRDSSVGMNLFKDFEDVNAEVFSSLAASLGFLNISTCAY